MRIRLPLLISTSLIVLAPVRLMAQIPIGPPVPPTTKTWTETASVGLTLTSGNRDTTTFNTAFEIIYDPKGHNVVKSDGLYFRGKSDGEITADRLGLNARDEYRLSPRAYVFAQVQFVKDRFKNIDYLAATTAGYGVRLVDTPETRVSIDAGLGGASEKNPDFDVRTSGAIVFAEKFTQVLTTTTTLTQSVTGLHKTDDLGDALYAGSIAVAAALTARTQLKVELLDTYKRQIPSTVSVKNDVAILLALVYRN